MQQNCVERSKSEQNFKRTNERNEWAYERKQQRESKKKKNTQQRPSIHRTSTTAMAIHWECVYDPIWEGNGALKHKIYTKSCVHSVRIFRFSCCWMYRQPIFFSVRLNLYGMSSVLAYRMLVMSKSTLCILSSCTNDGVSVLSSTYIFSFQYKFCGAVVASILWAFMQKERQRMRVELSWAGVLLLFLLLLLLLLMPTLRPLVLLRLLLFRICFEARVLLNDRKFNIHRQAFVHLFSISAHKAQSSEKQKAVSQPADTLTHFTWNTRIVVFAWLDCEG